MISTLIALPYELARLPLTLVDGQLSTRLPENSIARATLGRTIGFSDKIVGSVLRNRSIGQRGSERLERIDTLRAAARLEQEAQARREQAAETAAAGREEAAALRDVAQETATSGLDEADAAEARGKQQAEAEAAQVAAEKKKAADAKAEGRKAAAEERKRRAEQAATSQQQAAGSAAREELDDARATQQDAAETRADADRLEDLVETRKEDRSQG